MQNMKFYLCKHCKNLVWKAHDSGVSLKCCGEDMTELTANTVDAAQEKHVPVLEVNGNTVTVKVGEVEHPMLDEHFIGLIGLQTGDYAIEFKQLHAGEKPEATFVVADANAPMVAYEWCNLHGLWMAQKNG